MREKILIPGLVGASLLAAMTMAPLLASAVSSITSATIEPDKTGLEVNIGTATPINTVGTDGAFGYGVLNAGDSIMVATTHSGVLDSELQISDADPTWHNHYVMLNTDQGTVPAECAGNAALGGARVEVAALTFESPGEVKIDGASIKMEDLPGVFAGTNALTGAGQTFSPGTTADTAVSFTLNPLFDGDVLTNVCVENITPFVAETD